MWPLSCWVIDVGNLMKERDGAIHWWHACICMIYVVGGIYIYIYRNRIYVTEKFNMQGYIRTSTHSR